MTTTAPAAEAQVVVRSSRLPIERRALLITRRRRLELVIGIAVPIVLIGAWELAARLGLINPQFFPPPSKSFVRGWEMIQSGRLIDDLSATLYRIVVGYLAGGIVGFGTGIVMGVSRIVRKALEPLLSALYTVPKLAILPIFLTIFGFGDAPKLAIVAFTVFFYVWIYTMEAVISIPSGYLDAARSFGVGRWQMFRHVILPGSLPAVVVGLRIAIGVGVLIVIAAEFVVGDTGLGFLIFNARSLFRLEEAYAGIVTVAVVGVVLQGLVSWLGHRVTPWVRDRDATARGL